MKRETTELREDPASVRSDRHAMMQSVILSLAEIFGLIIAEEARAAGLKIQGGDEPASNDGIYDDPNL